jgi:lipoprotein NlpI
MLTWLQSTYHFKSGVRHLRAGRFDKAAAHFSAVIRLVPDHAAACLNRGVALQGMNDYRRAIDDFDRALAIGFRHDSKRALAYYGRGVSWKFAGDFDRAAADHDQALALDSCLALAHGELGTIAHAGRHDFNAAIAHLDAAIRLAPRHAPFYLARGHAWFDCGSFHAAETDLRYSINIACDPYALLLWYLASLKVGRDAAGEFASRARELKGRQWPFPIVALYLGKTGDDAVRAAASDAGERAAAEFFIGEWHLHARRRAQAIAALQAAAKSCPPWLMAHPAAVMELKRQRAPLTPDERGPGAPAAYERPTGDAVNGG